MALSKQALLRLAERGQLRRGSTELAFTKASRTNPKILLVTANGSYVGWIPYHPEYRSDTDKAIAAAINKAS